MKPFDENKFVVFNTSRQAEVISIDGVRLVLVRLPDYLRKIKEYQRLEPKLDGEVQKAIRLEIKKDLLTEIPGSGGWAKGRIASPSRHMGKSGGFRVIFLFLKVAHHVFLGTVYEHRSKGDLTAGEKSHLRHLALAFKREFRIQGGSHEE